MVFVSLFRKRYKLAQFLKKVGWRYEFWNRVGKCERTVTGFFDLMMFSVFASICSIFLTLGIPYIEITAMAPGLINGH